MQLKRLDKSVQVFLIILFVLGVSFCGSGFSLAQEPGQYEKAAIPQEIYEWQVLATSPGVEILSEHRKSPGQILSSGVNPMEAAQNWLAQEGFEEGRNLYKGELLYISFGSAIINAGSDDPNFIDSRYLAFQRAELEAKAKIALFLGVDLTTSRGSSEREINPADRAALEEIVNTSPVIQKNSKLMEISDTIYSLFQKGKIVAGAKLDQEIERTGVDVTEEWREAKHREAAVQARRDRKSSLRYISEASLKASASVFQEIQGAQIYQSFEGSYENEYQIVVISLWSQNLQRLVESMQEGIAPRGLPRIQAKEEIRRQLPKKPNELACLTGVRAYINEHGEHALLSFGQSGVNVLAGRKGKALELAGKKARLRALASMRQFMGEKIAFTPSGELMEVLALYANEEQDYKLISQFQEKIKAVSKKQKITGIQSLVTRELTHPFTDRPIVLKVMTWSPASQAMAQELKQTIKHGVKDKPGTESVDRRQEKTPARKGIISSGSGADKDAF
jgi:hypothetical protein